MTTQHLADILVRCGVVDRRAVEDPDGFDNYRTLGCIAEAAVVITAAEAEDNRLLLKVEY